MSKISIANEIPLPPNKQDAQLLMALKKVTGLGLTDIKERLAQGKAAHLLRAELFLNDHVEVDSQMREMLAILNAHHISSYILEIRSTETWDDPPDPERAIISEEVLINLLNTAKDKFS